MWATGSVNVRFQAWCQSEEKNKKDVRPALIPVWSHKCIDRPESRADGFLEY